MSAEQAVELDVGEFIEHQARGGLQRALLFWSLMLMLFEGYDMQVLAFAAPLISREWGIERGDLGTVFGAGLLGYMIGATALSGFADRYGRKVVVIGGTLLFGVLTFASIAAASVGELLALRFGAGLGLGASIPALIALNAEYAPARSRGSRISILYVGYCLGGMLGGLMAAQLMPAYGWKSVFIVGGAIPVALAAVLYFTLPESIRLLAVQQRAKREVIALARRLAPHRTFTGGESFVVKEHSEPGLAVRHLFTEGRAPITVLMWSAFIASLLGHHFLTAWLPSVLESAGMPLSEAVNAGAFLMGGAALGSLVCGWLFKRYGMVTVIALFLVSAPIVAAIGFADLSRGGLLLLVFMAGVTLIGAHVGLSAIAGTIYPTYIRSSGAGWALGVGRIGAIAGPVLGGVLIGMGTAISTLLIYAALPALCAAAFVALVRRLVPPERDTTQQTH